jgi:hypothetical protein
MYCTFYNTNDVFLAEEYLNNHGVECSIVPTPIQDKAYCGVCIQVDLPKEQVAEYLVGLEYNTI